MISGGCPSFNKLQGKAVSNVQMACPIHFLGCGKFFLPLSYLSYLFSPEPQIP